MAGTGRAPRLAAARIARPESRAAGAERKWRLPLCTNHVRPAGECHPAPGAGRRARGGHSDLHRVPETPRGFASPQLLPAGPPHGPRRLPAPTPRPFRSQGGSGPARQAGPGAPAGTQRRSQLGRAGVGDPCAQCPPGTRLSGALSTGTSAVTKPQGQARRWPAGRRTRRPWRVAAAQPPGSRARRPGPRPTARGARPARVATGTRRPSPDPEPSGRAHPGSASWHPSSLLWPLPGHGYLGTAGASLFTPETARREGLPGTEKNPNPFLGPGGNSVCKHTHIHTHRDTQPKIILNEARLQRTSTHNARHLGRRIT